MILNCIVSATLKDVGNVGPLLLFHVVLDVEDPLLFFGPTFFFDHWV
jgi:hypothetical protein